VLWRSNACVVSLLCVLAVSLCAAGVSSAARQRAGTRLAHTTSAIRRRALLRGAARLVRACLQTFSAIAAFFYRLRTGPGDGRYVPRLLRRQRCAPFWRRELAPLRAPLRAAALPVALTAASSRITGWTGRRRATPATSRLRCATPASAASPAARQNGAAGCARLVRQRPARADRPFGAGAQSGDLQRMLGKHCDEPAAGCRWLVQLEEEGTTVRRFFAPPDACCGARDRSRTPVLMGIHAPLYCAYRHYLFWAPAERGRRQNISAVSGGMFKSRGCAGVAPRAARIWAAELLLFCRGRAGELHRLVR